MPEQAPFTAIDFSRLPPPEVVQPLDFESVREGVVAQLRALMPEFNALLPSDPAIKLIDAVAYSVLIERQRQNDACRAVLLPFAVGADLDNLAALFGVGRRLIAAADPVAGTPAVWEGDAELRTRVALAPEGYSVAGPEGAYVYHALAADPGVLDASASSPPPADIRALVLQVLADNAAPAVLTDAMVAAMDAAAWPTDVRVSVLSRDGDGSASPALLASVESALSADAVRPLSDHVTVQSAQILQFEIEATLYTYPGPDSAMIRAEALRRLDLHLGYVRRLGRDVTRTAIIAALHPEGVQRVELASPAADIIVARHQCAHPNAITVDHGGYDE